MKKILFLISILLITVVNAIEISGKDKIQIIKFTKNSKINSLSGCLYSGGLNLFGTKLKKDEMGFILKDKLYVFTYGTSAVDMSNKRIRKAKLFGLGKMPKEDCYKVVETKTGINNEAELRKQFFNVLYAQLMKANPGKYNMAMRDVVYENKIKIGMTKEESILSWNYPDDINKTTGSFGVLEQWIYRGSNYDNTYVYFENGRLKSWQN